MRTLSAVLLLAVLVTGCQAPAALDEAASEAVDIGSLPVADFLAGLEATVVPDAARAVSDLETFSTTTAPLRHNSLALHEAARDAIETAFLQTGLETERQDFAGRNVIGVGSEVPGQNILGVLPGATDRMLIFGAHYDGAETGVCHAYDNGSGVFTVIELARAMSAYEWEHTLVFAAWDYEESGLMGAEAYAAHLNETGADVDLYLNYDMVGLNWPAVDYKGADVPLSSGFGGPTQNHAADLWAEVTTHLDWPEEANAVQMDVTGGGSDHTPFLENGFPAVTYIGMEPIDYPFYHTADTMAMMDLSVGGDRADVVAGFDAVLESAFLYTFVLDQHL